MLKQVSDEAMVYFGNLKILLNSGGRVGTEVDRLVPISPHGTQGWFGGHRKLVGGGGLGLTFFHCLFRHRALKGVCRHLSTEGR
jgi:hypothetical protein